MGSISGFRYWLLTIISFDIQKKHCVKENPSWALSPKFSMSTRSSNFSILPVRTNVSLTPGPIICVEPNKSCVNHRHRSKWARNEPHSVPCYSVCGQQRARGIWPARCYCALWVWLLVTMMRDFSQSDNNDARAKEDDTLECVYVCVCCVSLPIISIVFINNNNISYR